MRRGTAKPKKVKAENEIESAVDNTTEEQGTDENALDNGTEANNGDAKTTTSQKRKVTRGKKEEDSFGDTEHAEPAEKKPKRVPRKVKNVTETAPEVEGEEYEVEKIVDMKDIRGKRHFKIHWKGYGPEGETWEKENDLNCPDLIKQFLDHLPSKAKKKQAKSASSKATKKNTNSEAEHTEYEVAQVVQMKIKKNGKREFLVHWKGFTHAEDTWEPEQNLNCPELIEEFLKKEKEGNEKAPGKNPAGRQNRGKKRVSRKK